MPFLTTALVAGGIAAASAGASVYGAHKQADAAKNAANVSKTAAQQSLDFQKQEYADQQANEKPFVQAGQGAVNNLAALANDPNFSKYSGGQFAAPTLEQAENMPGYKFQLEQGTNAINQNAAANGTLLTGNTGKALTDYGQGLAQTDYNNLYNQALSTYQNNYNVWNNDTTNQFNRLGQVAGLGANAAANAGSQGQAAANNITNTNLTSAGQQSQDLNNAGAATAAGAVGATNSLGNLAMLPLYSSLFKGMYAQTPKSGSI